MSEFALIQRLRGLIEALPAPGSEALRLDIGDDAAVWQPSPNKELVLTCDAFVQGTHFLPPQSAAQWRDAGHRVAAANLSDLAAMAATPRFALVSLGLPKALPTEDIEALYAGIVGLLHPRGCRIIGGNVTGTEGPLFVDITAAGEVEPGQAISRRGARHGDRIGVTGFPGCSAAGLELCLGGRAAALPFLSQAFLRPTPRLDEARLLQPHIHAMTDISDGLFFNLHSLLHHTGARLHALPIHPELQAFCASQGRSPQELLFGPSDDYELLFCAPSTEAIDEAFHTHPTALHWIGEIDEALDGIYLQRQGSLQKLHAKGWDHLAD